MQIIGVEGTIKKGQQANSVHVKKDKLQIERGKLTLIQLAIDKL
jgi:hypothetical protein